MEKWHGSFAQTQLEKFGWENGEGLGKNKHGNVKHINVTVKNDKKGVGVNQGQWEFAWWDHLYNKSASSVVVAKDEEKGEIKVQTKAKGETRRSRTGIISTQKPTGKSIKEEAPSTMSSMADERNMMDSVEDIHMTMAKKVASASLYGAFVKSATSVDISNTNSPAPSTPASSTPDDSEDDELKDYSIKITDAELFAACEGRTARKGGRGLVDQKGKFKRVMKEYLRHDEEGDSKKDTKEEKKNKKKRKHADDKEEKDKKESKKLKKDKKEKKDKKDKEKKDKEKKDKKEKKEKKDKKDKKEKKEKKSKA